MTTPQPITITTKPTWAPLSWPLGARVHFHFSAAERRVLRRRRPIPVSEWCERHRVVTMSSLPGMWRNEVTPYLAGIMDASFFESVQEITLCKAPQTGGSEAVNNCIGYASDRAPGPALYVYPDELTARENCQDRITPMFSSSPRLREGMTGRDDDAGALKIKLASMPIYMAWSRSVSRLANKPIRYLVFDETDKYQSANLAETDPIKLGEARTTTFRWTRKIWKISSPTVEAGYIWQALISAQVIFEFVAKCPTCGGTQVMFFDGIRWPEEIRDPDLIETRELATYQCAHCPASWSDYQRDLAIRAGHWQAKNDPEERTMADYLAGERPRRIGFHLPSWLSTFVSLSKVAGAFLRCKTADGKNIDLNALKNFMNTHKAEPWVNDRQDRQEDQILRLVDPSMPRGIVPRDPSALILVVDTQAVGFHYQVVAFSWGRDLESWRIDHGFVEDFAHLVDIAGSDYADADGIKYRCQAAFIDSGGGTNPHQPKHSRTAEVYEFCRRHPLFKPLKGRQTQTQPWNATRLDHYPSRSGAKIPIPGGLTLYTLNVTLYKDAVASKLMIEPHDPGAWHLHAEVSDDFARQMCAEFQDERGFWQCPRSKPNHHWDIATYTMAAADILGLKNRRKERQAPQRRIISKGVTQHG
jgi:phage terminase large subunit GpA-like protein